MDCEDRKVTGKIKNKGEGYENSFNHDAIIDADCADLFCTNLMQQA